MKKHSLKVLVLFLSIVVVPWPYRLGTQSSIVQAAEMPEEEIAESDLSKMTTASTVDSDVTVPKESETVPSESTVPENEATTDQITGKDGATDASDTQEVPDGSSEVSNIQESFDPLEQQLATVYNGAFITPSDLGNEQWLMDEVTRQAQSSYPGMSVENNNIPRSFLETITSIYLTSTNTGRTLQGVLPPEIANLVNLQTLQFSGTTNLTGAIPDSIGSLTNLRVLSIHNTGISGSIPANIGNLVNLRTLNFSTNRSLTGTIPESIGNLTTLTTLSINITGVSGNIPDTIGNLTNLTRLDLGSNSLSGTVPSSIGALVNLTSLNLQINLSLSGQLPESMGNLVNLRNVWLSNNNFSGPLPSSISNWKNLQILSAGNNNFSGTIPEGIGNAQQLTHLQLNNNGFEGEIPTSLGNLSNIGLLYLHNNKLSGGVPSSLSNIPVRNNQLITLSDNSLTGILPHEILEKGLRVAIQNTELTINESSVVENNDFNNTFVNTSTAWHLAGTDTPVKRSGTIKPFDPSQDSFFDLKRVRGEESQALFDTHRYTIYAGDLDTGEVVYDGLADPTVSFEAPAGINHYTIVMDTASKNPNNVTQVKVSSVTLTAEAISQKVTLGSSLESIDPKMLVKNVMLNDQVLPSDAYTVTVLTQPDTTIVKPDNEAKVQVSYDQINIELAIPVEVLWGNTILTRGINNWSTGAYTYHPETQKVTSRLGISEGDGPIHNHFDRYYSLDFYRPSKDKEVLNKDNLYYSYVVNGTDTKYQVIENFGDKGELNVSVGDVLKMYHAEPGDRLVQFRDEIASPISTNTSKEAYLELTDKGYKLLTFDRAVPIERTIKVGMTQEELEKTVTQSLELSATKDVSVLGFTKYPDTSVKGTSSGTIRVEETLSTGKKVQYDYEVSFVVEAGDLKLSEVTNGNFEFGEAKRSSQRQEIQATGTTAPKITISDYSDTTKWSLYVSSSPFVNQKNQELSGAQLTLKNFSLVNTVHQSLMVNSRAIVLSPSTQIVAAMTNPEYINGIENGETILQLGEAKDNVLTGISLSLPANTPMDAGDYKATITWELVGDPTL